jgi:hypothetical protein
MMDWAEPGNVAAALVQGRGFSDPFDGGTGATAWVSPLPAWVEAAVFLPLGAKTPAAAAALLVLSVLGLAAAHALLVSALEPFGAWARGASSAAFLAYCVLVPGNPLGLLSEAWLDILLSAALLWAALRVMRQHDGRGAAGLVAVALLAPLDNAGLARLGRGSWCMALAWRRRRDRRTLVGCRLAAAAAAAAVAVGCMDRPQRAPSLRALRPPQVELLVRAAPGERRLPGRAAAHGDRPSGPAVLRRRPIQPVRGPRARCALRGHLPRPRPLRPCARTRSTSRATSCGALANGRRVLQEREGGGAFTDGLRVLARRTRRGSGGLRRADPRRPRTRRSGRGSTPLPRGRATAAPAHARPSRRRRRSGATGSQKRLEYDDEFRGPPSPLATRVPDGRPSRRSRSSSRRPSSGGRLASPRRPHGLPPSRIGDAPALRAREPQRAPPVSAHRDAIRRSSGPSPRLAPHAVPAGIAMTPAP